MSAIQPTAAGWHDSPFRAPLCAPVPAASSSDDGPAPEHVPPTIRPAHAPLPVAAPSESPSAASRMPESSQDDPFAELSPGPLSATPLLHPQRQRELIEQAAGMSTRQVAGLLAATAPEVVLPRDTLRAVAPDRYTLKVSIDQKCDQGLRLLKDLLSHLDPRMSWGDLVARLVRAAVARHDPRGGGSGQRRRRRAGSAGASRRRAPKNTRPAAAPAVPAQRGGGDTPAPQGDTAAAGRQNPVAMLANAAPPSQSAPAALSGGARAGGVPSAAPDAAAGRGPRPAPHRLAPMPASRRSHRSPLRRRSRHSACSLTADRPARQPGQRRTQPAILSTAPTNPRRGATFLRLSGATSGNATEDAAVIAIRSPGVAAPHSHLLQINHLLPVAEGGGPDPFNLQLSCFAHHRMGHGHGPAPPPEPPM